MTREKMSEEEVVRVLKEAEEKADRIWHLADEIYVSLKSVEKYIAERRSAEMEDVWHYASATLTVMFFDSARLRSNARDLAETMRKLAELLMRK